MLHSDLLKEIHLFESRGHKIAFSPSTYGIALLDDEGYSALLHPAKNKPVAHQMLCNLAETHFVNSASTEKTTFSSDLLPSLQSLCLIVTSRCNLNCEYCYNDGGLYDFDNRQKMSLETAKNAITFLLSQTESRQCEVSFFGGEPLTEFNLIKDTVIYAKDLAMQMGISINFHVTTNGTLITKEIAHFLKKHDFSLIVSIDGDKETHDCHRKMINGNGTFDSVMKGVQILFDEYETQEKITIRGTYTHEQKSFSQSFLSLAEMGFNNISIEPCFGKDIDEYVILDNDLPDISNEYHLLADSYSSVQSQYPNAHFFHFEKIIRDLRQYNRTSTPCGAANGYMAVAPDGGLYPCHRIIEAPFKLGDVNGDEVLHTELQSSFWEAKTENRQNCKSCWANSLCGGSCYANSVEIGLDLCEQHEVGCKVTKSFIEQAIGIFVEQKESELSRDHFTIVNLPPENFTDQKLMSCPVRASCDSGCQSSCTSGCTSGCLMGCQSWCTGGCTSGCTSGRTSN